MYRYGTEPDSRNLDGERVALSRICAHALITVSAARARARASGPRAPREIARSSVIDLFAELEFLAFERTTTVAERDR